ncbi:histidine kinase [Paenibacillus alkaliterrae]|uniref:sensor histidine kinase n=1 Tax=Paenibacillus alkaliterrae TaxID=320909 RepID=UPI001F364E34|nr:histidine kinase [Paenibacillus alkaliterrae]MCF2938668.1 histidine kinase [Paenibacillus alkaliterrae]
MRSSLHYKLIIGFISIAVPLVALLLYNNVYASNTVREQVTQSNKNAVMLYANQIQAALDRETNFLYNLTVDDPNITLLSRYLNDPTEYMLTKVRILNELSRYHRFDSSVDFQFIYSIENKDLFNTAFKTKDYNEVIAIKTMLTQLLDGLEPDSPFFWEWKSVQYGDDHALVRLVDTREGFYLGAFVRLSHMMIPPDLIQLGDKGFASFILEDGEIIAGEEIHVRYSELPLLDYNPDDTYQLLHFQDDRYVAVTSPIKGTDTMLSVFIPEREMLRKLPYFKWIISIIPVLAAIVLLFYIIYLRDIVLKPMNKLIRGMVRIKEGNLSIRLQPSKTKDFTLINETFNDMAEQIEELKISVYEERIEAHRAELKHLQLQMNPHFILNAINILYNLAQLKKYDIIQMMCLNMVNYFRFTTQTHRSVVRIAEELEHMESYINIQQHRFPGKITYRFEVEDGLEKMSIPPLLIQPFIENSMKYGFDFMEKPFHIDIRITSMPDSQLMQIVISDNGAGFSEPILAELQNGRYFGTQDGEHLGIWNVYHRLHFLFGQTSRIQFANGVDSGANVTIWMPVRTLEQFA